MTAVKQVIIEGTANLVSVRGIGLTGKDIGSEEEYAIRLGNKGNAAFVDLPVGARLRVTVEVLP